MYIHYKHPDSVSASTWIFRSSIHRKFLKQESSKSSNHGADTSECTSGRSSSSVHDWSVSRSRVATWACNCCAGRDSWLRNRRRWHIRWRVSLWLRQWNRCNIGRLVNCVGRLVFRWWIDRCRSVCLLRLWHRHRRNRGRLMLSWLCVVDSCCCGLVFVLLRLLWLVLWFFFAKC